MISSEQHHVTSVEDVQEAVVIDLSLWYFNKPDIFTTYQRQPYLNISCDTFNLSIAIGLGLVDDEGKYEWEEISFQKMKLNQS